MTKQEVPVTQSVRVLRKKKIDFTPHFYAYQDHGGTGLSSESLGVPEHSVIKTIVLETNEKKPLIVLMHGDCEISTKNLARFLGVKSVSPSEPDTANRHTGYLVGGTSPFGTLKAMPVYAEASIFSLNKIYINGGKRGFLVEIHPNDIRKALELTEVNVAIQKRPFDRPSFSPFAAAQSRIKLSDSLWSIPILFITGVIAGLVDSITGGGGLITIPVLLGIGLPPQVALGTNKFQASFGSLTATAYHIRKKNIELHNAWPGVFSTLVGAALGAWAVQQLDANALGKIIPFMLAGILLYTFFVPKLGDVDTAPHVARTPFFIVAGLALGFYDGFFGPGVGSFWAIAFVALLGFNLSRATGYTKLMNFVSNIVSLAVFAIGGHVWVASGIAMGIGQIFGARIGSGFVIRKGASFIRPIFITMVVLLIIKVFYDKFIA